MIEMLSGALVLSYLLAGAYFFRFWKRTGDRIFMHFAAAFWLFVVNQLAVSIPSIANAAGGYEYLLRVIGYIVIIVGIVDKNVGTSPSGKNRAR